jgi:hypothetical protein
MNKVYDEFKQTADLGDFLPALTQKLQSEYFQILAPFDLTWGEGP